MVRIGTCGNWVVVVDVVVVVLLRAFGFVSPNQLANHSKQFFNEIQINFVYG